MDIHKTSDMDSLFELAELFKNFGDTTRIRILSALSENEMCVQDLADMLVMGQSAISHQLRYLRTSGLIKVRRDGKNSYYSLDDDHVKLILNIGVEHIKHKRGVTDD